MFRIKKPSKIGIVSIALALAAGIAAGGYALLNARFFQDKGTAPVQQTTVSKVTQNTSVTKAWDGSCSNFLICGIDNTNVMTDVIMVVQFNNKTGKINILQIPRDTFAGYDIPSYKYNAIYSHHATGVSGMLYLEQHIQDDFGIRIDHYISITTKGLRNLVDSVGGVDLYVPINMNYDDSAQDLHIHLKKGYQHLNGSQAEQFVRDRHDWADADIGRLNAQKTFLATLATKLKSMNVLQLTTKVLPSLMPPNFTTDMTTLNILQFGLAAQKIKISNVSVFTVPGEACQVGGIDVYSVHKQALVKLLNANFEPTGTVLTSSNLSIRQIQDTGATDPRSDATDFGKILLAQQSSSSSASSEKS